MTTHQERYARFARIYADWAAPLRGYGGSTATIATYHALARACADEAARPAPHAPDADACPATLRTGGTMIATE